MPALSTKDKLKLRLSAAKVERWNRERLKPAVNPDDPDKPIRCRSVKWAHGREKPAIEYADKGTVPSHDVKVNPKAYNSFLRRGDSFADYQDADYSESPRDPAWKANLPSVAKARPNSPFKRAGKSAASVVIVRK